MLPAALVLRGLAYWAWNCVGLSLLWQSATAICLVGSCTAIVLARLYATRTHLANSSSTPQGAESERGSVDTDGSVYDHLGHYGTATLWPNHVQSVSSSSTRHITQQDLPVSGSDTSCSVGEIEVAPARLPAMPEVHRINPEPACTSGLAPLPPGGGKQASTVVVATLLPASHQATTEAGFGESPMWLNSDAAHQPVPMASDPSVAPAAVFDESTATTTNTVISVAAPATAGSAAGLACYAEASVSTGDPHLSQQLRTATPAEPGTCEGSCSNPNPPLQHPNTPPAVSIASDDAAESADTQQQADPGLASVHSAVEDAEQVSGLEFPAAEGYNLQGLPAQQRKGLYPIICEQQENQNEHMVNKILSLKPQFLRLIGDVVPSAAGSAAMTAAAMPSAQQHINFEALNAAVPGIRCMGCYGSSASVLRYLTQQCGMPDRLAAQLAEPGGPMQLQPGITVWVPALTAARSRPWWLKSSKSPLSVEGTAPSAAHGPPDLFALIVGNNSAFSSPNVTQTFNSYLRYGFELCSDLVLVMSDQEAAAFNPDMYPFAKQNRGQLSSFKLERQTQQELTVVIQGPGFSHSYPLTDGQGAAPKLSLTLQAGCCSSSSPAMMCTWRENARMGRFRDCLQVPVKNLPAALHNLQQQYNISISDGLKKQLCMGSDDMTYESMMQKPLVQLLVAANPAMAAYVEQLAADVEWYASQYRTRLAALEQQLSDQQAAERRRLECGLQAVAACWSPQLAAEFVASHHLRDMVQAAVASVNAIDQGLQQQCAATLACPICLEAYDTQDRVPVGLPCGSAIHVFCRFCQLRLVNGHDAGPVNCPICRHPHQLQTVVAASRCLSTLQMLTEAADRQHQLRQLSQQLICKLQVHSSEAEARAMQLLTTHVTRLPQLYKVPHPVGDSAAPFTAHVARDLADKLMRKYFLSVVLLENASDHSLPGCLLPPELHGLPFADEFFPAAVADWSVTSMIDYALDAAAAAQSRWQRFRRAVANPFGSWFARNDLASKWLRQADARAEMVACQNSALSGKLRVRAVEHVVQHMITYWLARLKDMQQKVGSRLLREIKDRFQHSELSVPGYYKHRMQELLQGIEQQLQSYSMAQAVADHASTSSAAFVTEKLHLEITHYSQRPAKRELDASGSHTVLVPEQSVLKYKAEQLVQGSHKYLLHRLLASSHKHASGVVAATAAAPSGSTDAAAAVTAAAPDVDILSALQVPVHHKLLLAQAVEKRSGMFLYVLSGTANNGQRAECRVQLSHRMHSNWNHSSSTVLKLSKHITAAAFDSVTRLLLLVCAEDQLARLYMFDDQYQMPRQLHDIRLADMLPGSVEVLLVPGKKEAILIDTSSAYLYDIVNNKTRSACLQLPPTDSRYCFLPAPGGSVLVLLTWQGPAAASAGTSTSASISSNGVAGANCCPARNNSEQPSLVIVDPVIATSGGSHSGAHQAGSGLQHSASDSNADTAADTAESNSKDRQLSEQKGQWVLHAYCLEIEANRPLLSEIQAPMPLGQRLPVGPDAAFKLCSIGSETHLVAFELNTAGRACGSEVSNSIPAMICSSLVLHVTNFSQSNVLKATENSVGVPAAGGIRASGNAANAMLNYLYSAYDKFPAQCALGHAPGPTRLWVMMPGTVGVATEPNRDSNASSSTAAALRMSQYLNRLWVDVQSSTCKPFVGLDLQWEVLNSWQTPANLLSADASSSALQLLHPGLGSWIETAMMLVPLQLCRCEGNTLWPMSDGLMLHLDEEDTDVNRVADKISLGVYDIILSQTAAAGQERLPVVVVSSMGAQSIGKSYQLNHLAGCFFDVAGGRCTDGCWLTIRKHRLQNGRPCLLVLLDFEGIGSWERTEQEDMLLSLLSAALSNVTLFKTHFTFDRYTQQTLQRFNLGAPKVRAMCAGSDKRVFAGDIVFCLKDVVGSAVDDVKEEFQRKLTEVVQSHNNFMTALYQGGAHLMDFPYPEDVRFYRELGQLAEEVITKTKHPFSSGTMLGEQLRRLMAKISHKDWTPIHRDQVRAVVRALQTRLHQACAAGCLTDVAVGRPPPPSDDLQHLVVMDTGIAIADTSAIKFEVLLSAGTYRQIDAAAQPQSMRSASPVALFEAASDVGSHYRPDAAEYHSDAYASAEEASGMTVRHLISPKVTCIRLQQQPKLTHMMEATHIVTAAATEDHTNGGGSSSSSSLDDLHAPQVDAENSSAAGADPIKAIVKVNMCDSGVLLQALTVEAGSCSLLADEQVAVIQQLKKWFLELLPCCGLGRPDEGFFHQNLQSFLLALVARRGTRVEQWVNDNMRFFLADHEAKKLLQTTTKAMEQVHLGLQLCGSKCSQCFLPCLQPRGHSSPHDCLESSHSCPHDCGYCTAAYSTDPSVAHATSKCQAPAGHPGPHSCGDPGHQCGMTCSLADKSSNCAEHCCLPPGHTREHLCGTRVHLCGSKCSLDVCDGSCCLPYDHDPSIRHQCNVGRCPVQCQLCNSACCCDDHFHSEQAGVVHLCGKIHPCSRSCAAEGMCEIRSELRREKRTFIGERGTFEYDYITQQACKTHQCAKMIPADAVQHEGRCIHDEDEAVLHFCGHPCPNCGYRCTRPHGHQGRHETQHGNMRHTFFVSDASQSQDIDIGERKYVRGERGLAETCDNYCSVMGRGHVHVLPCDPAKCDVGGQASLLEGRRRHARCQYSDGQVGSESEPKDELTHDAYWEVLQFEDPCSCQQQQEFRRCGAICGSHAHDQDESEGQPLPYCQLPLWHPPYTGSDDDLTRLPPGVTIDHVTAAGHGYVCKHNSSTYGWYHTILVIDRSYSMASQRIRPVSPELRSAISHSRLPLDNVAGVTCEAALAYMRIRQSKNPRDLVSCVTFDEAAWQVFQRQTLSSPAKCSDLIRHIMPQAVPRGGTNFWSGLAQAFDMVPSAAGPSVTNNLCQSSPCPVIVLLTDSGDWYQDQSLRRVQRAMAGQRQVMPEALVPQLHVIGYGADVDERFIQQLSAAGNGSHMVCTNAAGTQTDMARLQLVSAFEQLADRPDRRGALMTGSSNASIT